MLHFDFLPCIFICLGQLWAQYVLLRTKGKFEHMVALLNYADNSLTHCFYQQSLVFLLYFYYMHLLGSISFQTYQHLKQFTLFSHEYKNTGHCTCTMYWSLRHVFRVGWNTAQNESLSINCVFYSVGHQLYNKDLQLEQLVSFPIKMTLYWIEG